MTTYSLIFDGTLTAISPLATCPPGTPETGKNKPQPIPRATVPIDGQPVSQVPYFPGPGIRGTLRRRAFDAIRGALQEDAPIFTVDDYYYLVLGGVKGAEKEDKTELVNARKRRAEMPIIGLFGGGAPWDKSHLFVGGAYPTAAIEAEVVGGARVDDFGRSPETLQILSLEEQARFADMARANSERSRKNAVVKDIDDKIRQSKKKKLTDEEVEALKAEKVRLEAEIKKLDEEAFSTNSVNRPLDGYEVIPAGTAMSNKLVLRYGTEDEIGLTMATLRYWALDPHIGAHVAHGCGVVSGEWNVQVRRGMEPAYENVGTVKMIPYEGIEAPQWLLDLESAFMAKLRSREVFNFKAA